MVSPLHVRLDVNKKAAGFISRRSFGSEKTSLIVRFAGRRPADRRLVFHARVADVHALLARDLAVVRLAGQGCWICRVRLDFVVCP